MVVGIGEAISSDIDLEGNEDLRAAIRAHMENDLATAELYYRRIDKLFSKSNFVKYLLAHLLYDRHENLEEALALIGASCAREPDNASFHLLQGKILSALGQWDGAVASYQTVIDVAPRLPDPYHYLKHPMVASGRVREYVDILDAVQRRYPDLEVGRFKGFGADQSKAIAHDIPSILLITMPKSGSLYTANRLSDELATPQCRISLDLNPFDFVVASWVELFVKGGAICQEHLDASEENLGVLESCGVERLQIHVRDPRQATLSWVHHIETMTGKDAYLRDLVSPALPAHYEALTVSEKIDWNIDNHLPGLVKWTDDWIAAAEERRYKITMRFSRYEDFWADQPRFFSDLLEFFGVPDVTIDPLVDRNLRQKAVHFRRGEIDEWRRVFSPRQAERASQAISPNLYERFGWSR